ncbi:hypothetical protein Q7W17_03465 [Streptococcus suis]|nr:hypothetical protein [Streptococcus suis]
MIFGVSFLPFILIPIFAWLVYKKGWKQVLKSIFKFLLISFFLLLNLFILANVSLFHWTLITIVSTVTVTLFSKEIFQAFFGIDLDKSLYIKMTLSKIVTLLKLFPAILYVSIFLTMPEVSTFGVKLFFEIDVNKIVHITQSEQRKLTIIPKNEEKLELEADDRIEIEANDILILHNNDKKPEILSKSTNFEIDNYKWSYQLRSVIDTGKDRIYTFSPSTDSFEYKMALSMIRVLIIELLCLLVYFITTLIPHFYSKKIQFLLGLAPELKDFQGEWYQAETYDWYQKNFVYSLPSFVIKGETLIIKDRKIATPISYSGEGIEFEIGDTKYRLQLNDGKLNYNDYVFLHKDSSEYKALRKNLDSRNLKKQSSFLLKPVLVASPPFLRSEHIYFVQLDRLIATRTKEACFSNMDVIRKEIILPDHSRVPYSSYSDRFYINGRIYEIIE